MRVGNSKKDIRKRSHARSGCEKRLPDLRESDEAWIDVSTLRHRWARRLTALIFSVSKVKHEMVTAEVGVKQTNDSNISTYVACSANFESTPVLVQVRNRNAWVEVKVVIVGLNGRISGKDSPLRRWIEGPTRSRTRRTGRRLISGGLRPHSRHEAHDQYHSQE